MMYTIPKILKEEINEYRELIKDYRSGKTEPVKFKGIRVPMGVYEQRTDDTYMVRVRCTGGFISPDKLNRVAQIAQKYNAKYIHITTRQEIQIQDVSLENTASILEELFHAGLTARGGGGNTVRNIMASVDSGINKDETFDVLPYAMALTNQLIGEPHSWTLPRKFKIAFSSSDRDNAYTIFNDLGFIAKIKDGQKGFKVFIGGSLASKPMKGYVLFDFAPVEDLLYIVDSAKKLFSRYGNRKNKHKARLRFIFYKLGKEKVFAYFHEIFNAVKNNDNLKFRVNTERFNKKASSLTPEKTSLKEFITWKNRYCIPQKQKNLYQVILPVNNGNLKPEAAEKLSQFLKNFGDDSMRLSMEQNIHLRNIPENHLMSWYRFFQEQGYEINKSILLNSLVSCTGADTCRLGICLSKGVLFKLKTELENSGLNLDVLKNLRIKISGCPNSCGQQSIADLGFYGKIGRTDRPYPAYKIVAGARTGDANARLAEMVGEISARDLPQFTVKLLDIYLSKKVNYKTFADYIDHEGKDDIRKLCLDLNNIPSFSEDKNYYFDWGSDNLFSLAGRGIGECSAGLFDMIDFDLNTIKKYKDELQNKVDKNTTNKILYNIIFHTSRMLLITRGVEPKSTEEVFQAFLDNFIDAGLINKTFKDIVEKAKNNQNTDFSTYTDKIINLVHSVTKLYESMDDSLQFANTDKERQIKQPAQGHITLKKDYRGVACPINFVKTKIALSQIQSGEMLEILLDDGEPIDNVPGSVKSEGHEIIKQDKINDHWSIIIKKIIHEDRYKYS